MENVTALQAQLAALQGKTFKHRHKAYRVTRVRFVQAEQRYCVFTRGLGTAKGQSFIRHGAAAFKAFLEAIIVRDDKECAESENVAVPSQEVVEIDYKIKILKKRLMDANDNLPAKAKDLPTSINDNAAIIAQSLMKDFAALDENPTDDLYKKIDAKCKVTNTVVAVATMQMNAAKLKDY